MFMNNADPAAADPAAAADDDVVNVTEFLHGRELVSVKDDDDDGDDGAKAKAWMGAMELSDRRATTIQIIAILFKAVMAATTTEELAWWRPWKEETAMVAYYWFPPPPCLR